MAYNEDTRKKIVQGRVLFFFEVLTVYFGIFLFMLIPRILLPLLMDESTIFYGPVYYLLRALAILLAVPVFLYFFNIIKTELGKGGEIILEKDISPAAEHVGMFKIKQSNMKYQLLYGLLLLFLLFIPLDLLIYLLIPETLEYTANSLTANPTDTYLMASYPLFLASVLIIQTGVSIYEETLIRGFETKRGGDYFNKISAVFITSIQFGFMHFAIGQGIPLLFPFLWTFQAFLVGIILSLFIVNKKWLFPLIFAHAANNIISAHAIWNYLQGNSFIGMVYTVYVPLLIISVLLLIWQFPRIRSSVKLGMEQIKSYFAVDSSIKESDEDRTFRILLDLVLVVMIFFIAILLLV